MNAFEKQRERRVCGAKNNEKGEKNRRLQVHSSDISHLMIVRKELSDSDLH